jgi:hypothetical protein
MTGCTWFSLLHCLIVSIPKSGECSLGGMQKTVREKSPTAAQLIRFALMAHEFRQKLSIPMGTVRPMDGMNTGIFPGRRVQYALAAPQKTTGRAA